MNPIIFKEEWQRIDNPIKGGTTTVYADHIEHSNINPTDALIELLIWVRKDAK